MMISASHRRAVAAAMTAAMVAVSCLALLVASSGASTRRTVLAEGDMFDPMKNTALGSGRGGWSVAPEPGVSVYEQENPDAPNVAGGWNWATSRAPDGTVEQGHGPDWIYEGGPNPSAGAIRGGSSYYYNQWTNDEDGDFDVGPNVPAEDVTADLHSANEHSNFDHSTSEPYSAASDMAYNNPNAVDTITGVDSYLSSNGIY